MKKYNKYLIVLFILGVFTFVAIVQPKQDKNKKMANTKNHNPQSQLVTATFGAGCFWCVEAIFQQLEGVLSVASGYSGGHVKNPTYEDVCSGETGHAEVCQVMYDPKKITYNELLKAFWASHDPTTPNQQGADVGTQYRSVILYHDQHQKELAEQYKKKLNDDDAFGKPVVTEITPFREFFPAETYHQNYFGKNPDQPYCMFVIRPKLEKFEKVFRSKIKK